MTAESTVQLSGRVKWFDKERGFGFIVCDDVEGDVLVHVSRLKEYGLKSVPEGAELVVETFKHDRGLQVERIISIDMRGALPPRAKPKKDPNRVTAQPHGKAGAFELIAVRWYSAARGYGFLDRDGTDVFLHAEQLRAAGLKEVWPDDLVEARIALGGKGLVATELRLPVAEVEAA